MTRDSDVDEECQPLLDGRVGGAEKKQQDRMLGVCWTLVVAGLSLSTAIVTSLASGMEDVPKYTQNFIRCLAASVTLRITTLLYGESVLIPRESVELCVRFGIADWFFLWGYVKALIGLTVLQYAAMAGSLGPAIAAVMGCVFINERLSSYKILVLVRNMVLAVLIVDPFREAGQDISLSVLIIGLGWTAVAGMGTGAMRIVQRSNKTVPGTVLTFWGYVLNTILWFPPGCVPPEIRIPFLWPAEAQGHFYLSQLSPSTWIVLLLSGVLGAAVMVVQGFALKYLDVATYSMLVTPLNLVLTTLLSAFKHPLGRVAFSGVVLQVAMLLVDAYQERRQEEIQ